MHSTVKEKTSDRNISRKGREMDPPAQKHLFSAPPTARSAVDTTGDFRYHMTYIFQYVFRKAGN